MHKNPQKYRCDGEDYYPFQDNGREAEPIEIIDYFKAIKKYESTTKTETNGRINS